MLLYRALQDRMGLDVFEHIYLPYICRDNFSKRISHLDLLDHKYFRLMAAEDYFDLDTNMLLVWDDWEMSYDEIQY